MNHLKNIIYVSILSVLFILTGCNANKGIVQLKLTDAPIDASNVSGVYVTITSVEYHVSGSNWIMADDFTETQYNLLDLTNGTTSSLSTMELPAGKITQIRFGIDDSISGSSYGSYIEYDDGTADDPLTIPGGTDLKFVNEFDVPINGDTLSIIADFDVRKSIVDKGDGTFSLKPTIRLIVENEAGNITGTVTGNSGSVTVYAYEDGTWAASEADDPAPDSARFPNAVSSGSADDSGAFTIAFLAPMDYTLIVVETETNTVLDTSTTITVEAGKTANTAINL